MTAHAALCGLAAGLMAAAGAQAAGSTAGEFLKIVTAPRAAAMGGAATASGGPDGLQQNPALLAGADCLNLWAGHTAWVQGYSLEHAGAALPWGPGVAALHLVSGSSGQVPATDENGNAAGTFSQNDLAAGLTYAGRFGGLDLGLTGRFISRSLAGEQSSGGAADVGARLALGGGFKAGLAGVNMGSMPSSSSGQESLPATWRLGLSWEGGDASSFGMCAEAGASQSQGGSPQGRFGLEVSLVRALCLRLGSQFGEDLDQGQNWSAGLGLAVLGVRLDYAYSPLRTLGDAHRVALTAALPQFAGFPSRAAAEKAAARAKKAAAPKAPDQVSAPQGLTLRVKDGFLDMEWKPVDEEGVSGYAVYLLTGAGGWARLGPLLNRQTNLRLPLETLPAGTFRFCVRAVAHRGGKRLESPLEPGPKFTIPYARP